MMSDLTYYSSGTKLRFTVPVEISAPKILIAYNGNIQIDLFHRFSIHENDEEKDIEYITLNTAVHNFALEEQTITRFGSWEPVQSIWPEEGNLQDYSYECTKLTYAQTFNQNVKQRCYPFHYSFFRLLQDKFQSKQFEVIFYHFNDGEINPIQFTFGDGIYTKFTVTVNFPEAITVENEKEIKFQHLKFDPELSEENIRKHESLHCYVYYV